MSSNTKEIKIKIATDKPFRSIYWTPTEEELRQEIAEAVRYFEEQFPTASFDLRPKEEVWDSQGYPTMLDFPISLMIDLPNTSSFELATKFLMQRAKDAGFRKESRILNEKAWESIVKKNKNKSKRSQFFYLQGFFDSVFAEEMLFDLMKKVSHGVREIVLGFTARFFVVNIPFGGCSGIAEKGGNYAVFPAQVISNDLKKLILHEIGHLFGAQHIEDGISIMNLAPRRGNYLFDSYNIKIIKEYIEEL